MKLLAVAGKGGTGKTTIAALLTLILKDEGITPILAVDADPNYNLGEALGIPVEKTLGALTSEFLDRRAEIPAGMTKASYMELKMHQSVIESKDIDLIVMGRGEGPGCYCFVNDLMKKSLDDISSNYNMVIMDNEAGMEHLSRRTTTKIDQLFLVSDHTIKGIRAAGRLRDLVGELKIQVKDMGLIVNRVNGGLDPKAKEEIDKLSLNLISVLPEDPEIARLYLKDVPLTELQPNSPLKNEVQGLVETIKK